MKGNRLKQIERLIMSQIGKMQSEELKILIKNCEDVTQTNCGWSVYRLAPAIKGVAQTILESSKPSSKHLEESK